MLGWILFIGAIGCALVAGSGWIPRKDKTSMIINSIPAIVDSIQAMIS